MSEETKAQPDEITGFGQKVQEQSTDLMDGYTTHMTGAMSPRLGGSGYPEASLMRSRYSAMSAAAVQFTQDSTTGLLALAYASLTVAQNYREADSEQEVGMAGVDAAFTPTAGQPSLGQQRRDAAAAQARDQAEEDRLRRRMGEDPADDWTDGYTPSTTAPVTPGNVCLPPTASQQVQAHDDRAEEDEYQGQEAQFDPEAEAEAREQAAQAPQPTPSPTGQQPPTTSGPMNSPSGSNGPAAASPGPSPTPTPTPSN